MRAIMGVDLVEQLRYVVQATTDSVLCKVQAEFPERNYRTINYLYGRPNQINTELQAMATGDTSRYERYPLIALVEPVTITQPRDGGYPYANGFGIWIMCLSDKTQNSYQRQEYIERELYPIYEEFMKQLARTKTIVSQNPRKDLAHSVTIHKANPFYSDVADIIEIKDLQLKFYPSTY